MTSLDGGELSDEEDLNSPSEELPPSGPLLARHSPRPLQPVTSTSATIMVRPQRPHHRATRTQSDAEIERDKGLGGRGHSPTDSASSSPGKGTLGLFTPSLSFEAQVG